MTESPFEIAIPDEKLDLFRKKLELATFPDELEDADWKYGVPLAEVKRLTERWKNGYDWRKYEMELNDELPMFTRDIDVEGFGTLNIHYVRKKSTVTNAIPLLFCHGCHSKDTPVVDCVVSGSRASFHVVALSLPGYGFSEAPRKQGFSMNQFAEVAHKLMLALGYHEYVSQGGNWGSFIPATMVVQYGRKHHKTWHTNMPIGLPREPLSSLSFLVTPWTAKEEQRLARSHRIRNQGTGYFAVQCTQPQTIGYSLADSPVGLLGWIYEKLYKYSDGYPWQDDEVLTWISIYWFSRAGPAASMRIHFKFMNGKMDTRLSLAFPKIPMGASFFQNEIYVCPKAWVRRGRRIVAEFEHESGGHFGSDEVPQVLAGDVHTMFGKGGGAYGVVPGKDGYA